MSTVLTVSTQRIGRCYLHPWWYFIFVHCQCQWAQIAVNIAASPHLNCQPLSPPVDNWIQNPYSHSGPNMIFQDQQEPDILIQDQTRSKSFLPALYWKEKPGLDWYVRFPIEHYSLSWSSDSLECLTLLWCISIILPFVGQVAKVWWKSRNVWFNLE